MVARPDSMKFRDYLKAFWRIALGTAALLLTLGLIAFLFPQQALTIDSGEVKADAIVILGGGMGRAERGAQLYHDGAAPLIVVTGYGDCESNVKTLEAAGVPTSCITAEAAALSTLQNATYSVPLLRALRAQRVIIVTSWFHSRRALACFEHVAPDMQFFSRPSYVAYEPYHHNRFGYDWPINYEYVKLLVYWFSYGISPL